MSELETPNAGIAVPGEAAPEPIDSGAQPRGTFRGHQPAERIRSGPIDVLVRLERREGGALQSRAVQTGIHGDPVKPGFLWSPIFRDGVKVGDLTNCIFSYRLEKNIGFALIDAACAIGDRVDARVGGAMQPGILTDLPFL